MRLRIERRTRAPAPPAPAAPPAAPIRSPDGWPRGRRRRCGRWRWRGPARRCAAPCARAARGWSVLSWCGTLHCVRYDTPAGVQYTRCCGLLTRRWRRRYCTVHGGPCAGCVVLWFLELAGCGLGRSEMVGTRTSKGGRLQGLPSVRRLRDGPLESEDEDGSGDETVAARRGRNRPKAGATLRGGKVRRARSSTARSDSHRVMLLSDRRCARILVRSQTSVPALYKLPCACSLLAGKNPVRWSKGSSTPSGLSTARMVLADCQRVVECGQRCVCHCVFSLSQTIL